MAFEAGSTHYHVEFVVETTGVVRLFPLDESATRPLPVAAHPLVITVRTATTGESYPVMLRPSAPPGTTGETTQFVGRLPARAVGGELHVRFTEFKVRGERFRFEFDWVSPTGAEAFRSAFRDEQRRILLAPGGRYQEADIRANGGRTTDERFSAATPIHDHTPKIGDRLCPVSGFKAEPTFAWAVGGQRYWFCCQPCIDDFVLLAKEQPERVKPVEGYVR